MIEKRLMQFTAIAVLQFSFSCCINSLSISLLAMTNVEETTFYEWSTEEVNLILNAFPLITTLAMIPNNYLPQFFRPETIITSSMFAAGLAYFSIPYAAPYGWWLVYLVLALIGNFFSAFSVCFLNLMSKWAAAAEQTKMMSIIITGKVFGGMFGSMVSGIIIEKFGWQYIFFIFGLNICFWSIALKFVLTDDHSTISESKTPLVHSDEKSIKNDENFGHPPWLAILKSPAIWAINCSAIALEFSAALMITQFPMYVKNVMKMDITETGLFVSMPKFIGWLALLSTSWVADNMIRKGTPIIYVRKLFNSISLWGYAMIMGLLCFTKQRLHVFFLMSIGEVSLMASTSGFGINIFDVSPNFAGSVSSIQGVILALAYSIGPLISGHVLQDLENEKEWHNLFIFGMFLLFIGNLIFLVFAEDKPQKWDRKKKTDVKKE